MLPSRNKKVRSNNKQLRMLIDYMDKNRDFVNRQQAVSPYENTLLSGEWEEVRAMLSQFGPDRSVQQWRHTWRDLRKKAREEASHSDSYISEISVKILKIIAASKYADDSVMPEPNEESNMDNQPLKIDTPPDSLDTATEIEIDVCIPQTAVKQETEESIEYESPDESLPLLQTMDTEEEFHHHEYNQSAVTTHPLNKTEPPTTTEPQTTTEPTLLKVTTHPNVTTYRKINFFPKVTTRPIIAINKGTKPLRSTPSRTFSQTQPNSYLHNLALLRKVATQSQPEISSESAQSKDSNISQESTAKEKPRFQIETNIADTFSNADDASTNVLQAILSTLSRQNVLLEQRNNMLALQARLESRHRLREARRK